MSTKSIEAPRWRVSRIKATPAVELCTVQAPDEAAAIAKAIELFEIEPRYQDRLMARRVKARG